MFTPSKNGFFTFVKFMVHSLKLKPLKKLNRFYFCIFFVTFTQVYTYGYLTEQDIAVIATEHLIFSYNYLIRDFLIFWKN